MNQKNSDSSSNLEQWGSQNDELKNINVMLLLQPWNQMKSLQMGAMGTRDTH